MFLFASFPQLARAVFLRGALSRDAVPTLPTAATYPSLILQLRSGLAFLAGIQADPMGRVPCRKLELMGLSGWDGDALVAIPFVVGVEIDLTQ
jgi:hypothetical protein